MSYIPRILLCGELSSFTEAAADMAVEVVGKISFTGSPERGENFLFPKPKDLLAFKPKDLHIFLDGKEISAEELRKILSGTADYIVFDDKNEFAVRYNDLFSLKIFDQFIPRETLFHQARKNFHSDQNLLNLSKIVREKNFSRLLDADGLFRETDFFMLYESFPKVEGVVKEREPILENFYEKIYGSLAECRFKFFDALLLAERTPEEFIDVMLESDGLSENILTFARKNSALEKFLSANENIFEKISAFPSINGNWYLLEMRAEKNFCVYVVTHKDAKLDALPDGYEIIHAGHAQAKEKFGYLGDDTGDHISELNLYLNETTALYWMWKNTSHSIVGLNHYRRFFTETPTENFSVEKILPRAKAEELLRDFDIIVAKNILSRMPLNCLQIILSGGDLEEFVSKIFEKHIARKQPEYLDAFKLTANSYTCFQYEMFLTRRKIFDAFCEWLFSFLLDVTEEVFARTNIRQISNPRKYRTIGIICERLMTVWLRKNRLRIKKLPVMFREGI
ncbi:MAG: DUF4422 domain-containing protein [Selenomonadaceae bacterium]|nr:DUF4422 domain-containing protein [Selenomonadaceae bacterium]MBQ9496416.1 DUF4422 domain-containing protein [Selenomonadaceae bacterium]